MELHFVTYASHVAYGMKKNQSMLSEQATKFGKVHHIHRLGNDDIKDFLDDVDAKFGHIQAPHKRIKDARYYAWKPYVILQTLLAANGGDIVIYHDAGRSCYKYNIDMDFNPMCQYIAREYNGIFVNFGPFRNKRYTKRDCFRHMGCDAKLFWDSNQANGSFGIYQRNQKVVSFVKEWLSWCMHESAIVTDKPSEVDEFIEFEAHRHDQSILTNLLLKHSIDWLKLDPKLLGKLPRPWGWEKDMCLAIEKIKHYATK